MASSMDGSHLYWIPSSTAEPAGPCRWPYRIPSSTTGPAGPCKCPYWIPSAITGAAGPCKCPYWIPSAIPVPAEPCQSLQIPSRCPYRIPSACPGLPGPADGHIRSHLPLLDLSGPADTSRCPYWIPSGGLDPEKQMGSSMDIWGELGWSRRSRWDPVWQQKASYKEVRSPQTYLPM